MYEYRVETCKVRQAAEAMNELTREGWRVVAATPNEAMGHGLVVTFERLCEDLQSPDE